MSDKLISLLPNIKRAREFYLYDDKGNRFLDLYLDNGRALNGHRPSGLSLALKNTLARGLYAPYPTIYQNRLVKLLQNEFSRYPYLGIYRSYESFFLKDSRTANFSDPLDNSADHKHMNWRPFLDIPEDCRLLKVSFPFPGCDVIALLAEDRDVLPPSDLISPYILAGLIRSWFDWKSRRDKMEPQSWAILDNTGHWKRTGPYLLPLCREEEYERLFRLYLDNGVFISPDYYKPSICAVDIKEGTLKKLHRNMGG